MGEHPTHQRATAPTFDKDPVSIFEPLALIAAVFVAGKVGQLFF